MRLPAHRHPSTTSRPDTVDAGTHGHRTPTLDTGHRTSGRSDTRTRHWTPDAGQGHRHADEGTAGIRTSWATMPSGRTLGHPTVFLRTAPAGLGNHDGSAVGHLPARDCLPHDQPAARSAGQTAPRRSALLRQFRVERRTEQWPSCVMAAPGEGARVLLLGGSFQGSAWTVGWADLAAASPRSGSRSAARRWGPSALASLTWSACRLVARL
jgi:hypothetical protein